MIRIEKQRTLFTLIIGIVLLYAIFSLSKIITTTAPDFSVFYRTAQNFLAGRNIYHDQTLYTGFGYPPVTAMLFLPITLLPYRLAQGVWIVISFIALLASVFLGMRIFGIRHSWQRFAAIIALVFLAFPTRFTFGMGQVNLVALFLLLASVKTMTQGKQLVSAVLFGTAFMLKPHLGLIILFLVTRRTLSSVVGALTLVALATFLTGAVFGWTQWITYLKETVPPLLVYHGREIYYNQGVGGAMARVFPLDLARVITMATTIILLLGTLILVRRKQLIPAEAMALFSPVLLLVEPLSWQHHYVFLLPTFFWLWMKIKNDRRTVTLFIISYLLIAWNIRQPVALSGTLPGNILLSHVFAGNIILYCLSLYALARRPTFY